METNLSIRTILAAVTLCIAVMAFVACGSGGYERSSAGVRAEQSMVQEPLSDSDTGEPMERKLIKEGNVLFESDDLAGTQRRLDSLMRNYQGYVASENTFHEVGRETRSLVLRVPAARFDALLAEALIGARRVDQKNVSVRDVTEEFVDVEARLRTKKELESRYLALLNKATTVEDILKIEQQIGALRAEIEGTEGRLRYLSNQTDLATLHVSYYQQTSVASAFGTKFKDGFVTGWDNFMYFLIGLVGAWPFLLLLAAVLWVVRRWLRRRKASGAKS